jgi:hypothetical protein
MGATTRFWTVLATASLLALGCAHRAPDDPGGANDFVNRSHPCAAVPPAELAALKSPADLDGCLEDVGLRAGTYPDAEVLFSCPASPTPMIILRGHGHAPYRPPDNALDRQRLTRELPERARDHAHDVAYYGPGYAAAPPCTTAGRGLVMSFYGYLALDTFVDGIRQWIQAHDLDVELVIFLVPRPPPPEPPGYWVHWS